MDNNILKIDLDIEKRGDAIKLLKQRLSYMHDLSFMDFNLISRIELVKKTKYGCKIYLKDGFFDLIPKHKKWAVPLIIINLQLLLGSDSLKEINTLINHYRLKMKYSNRLFDLKRYSDGTIRKAKIEDITLLITNYINNANRKKNYN